MSDTTGIPDLRVNADYQFGAGAGAALFPDEEPLSIRRSSGGRPRQVLAGDVDPSGGDEGDRLVSYGTDGRFTLGIAGGKRLREALDSPAYRVVVGEESEPFVREGRNTFAKFVREVDEAVRPGDEVLVVTPNDELLAVGRAELAAIEMHAFDTGMAVKVREGIGTEDET